jgi:hypothetical protein
MTTRRLVRFQSLDGSQVVTFGGAAYNWQTDEQFRLSLDSVAAADWAFDTWGTGVAPLAPAAERVSWLIRGATEAALETEYSAIRAKLLRIGRGYLIRRDADGTERRALARPAMMPLITRSPGQGLTLPVNLEFRRLSHWEALTPTTGSTTATTTSHAFTITNPGDVAVDAVVFRLRANSAGPTNDPSLANTTTGFTISTTRDLTNANHEIRIDTGRWAVEWSTDDGATYASDWQFASLGSGQVGMMRLVPGANSFTLTTGGSPNVTVEWSFFARYA